MHSFDWKTALVTIAAASVLAPAAASAQPGQPPPPVYYGGGYSQGHGGYYAAAQQPSPFWQRRGLTLGFSGGLGAIMSQQSNLTDCFDCDYNPVALSGSFQIGGMLNPRLALMFDLWVTGQTVSFDGTEFVTQAMAMFAAQYWATPRLWLRGGIGAAHLSYTFDNGLIRADEPVADGVAVMGAIGYEIVTAPYYALDLHLRVGAGTYEGIDDQVSATTVNLGFSWF